MPDPEDAIRTRAYVVNMFERATRCVEANELELATEHVADALYMLDGPAAGHMLDHMSQSLSRNVYIMVCKNYAMLVEYAGPRI
jgi:hypothetical protein